MIFPPINHLSEFDNFQPVSEWSSLNVVEWMSALNLYRYADVFKSKDIKGADLVHLDREKLMVSVTFLTPQFIDVSHWQKEQEEEAEEKQLLGEDKKGSHISPPSLTRIANGLQESRSSDKTSPTKYLRESLLARVLRLRLDLVLG